MTPAERRRQIRSLVREEMNEKVRTVYVDLKTANDSVINVSICYGEFGIENLQVSLQRRYIRNENSCYQIHSIDGKCNVYILKDLDKAFEAIV